MITKIYSNKLKSEIVVTQIEIKEGKILINNNYKIKTSDIIHYTCSICNKDFSNTLMNKRDTNFDLCTKCKRKNTVKNKYGVDNPFQSDEIKKKRINTLKEKYGVDVPLKNKVLLEKMKHTNIERYGVENVLLLPKNKEKRRKIKNKNYYNNLFTKYKDMVKPLFSFEEFIGCKENNSAITYEWECLKCHNIFKDGIENGRIPVCRNCFPLQSTSMMENDFFNWINNISNTFIEQNNNILGKKELDFYLPDYNLAIELNGLYWHSENNGNRKKYYHLDKTQECLKKDINLIHIFEDEWLFKKEIVKSIISSKLNIYHEKIHDRKCELKEITDIKIYKNFLEENHLKGFCNADIYYGLYYQNNLVSLMSFKKIDNRWELNRFCNKINYCIIDGFSKLLKKFIKNKNPKYLFAHEDLRYSDGDVYYKNNFKLEHISEPEYFYIKSKQFRYNKEQFQKNKLKDKLEFFDLDLTEWENMQLNGYDRIWDCGNLVFTYQF